MKREYVRGSKEHWKEIYEWAFGRVPVADWGMAGDYLVKDTCVMIKRREGRLFCVDSEDEDDKALYDVITTNPHWHEVKLWEDKPYEPKPFDKVLGWGDNPSEVRPDIFLSKSEIRGNTVYACAKYNWDHIKPYNEEEYLKSLK